MKNHYFSYCKQALLLTCTLFHIKVNAVPVEPSFSREYITLNELIEEKKGKAIEYRIIQSYKKMKQPTYVTMIDGPGAGFFNTFLSVLGGIHFYDKNCYKGLEIKFGSNDYYGPFHEPTLGNNWWNYYFEPLSVGDCRRGNQFVTGNGPDKCDHARFVEFTVPRIRAHQLIKAYIKLKPHIIKIVNDFQSMHFAKDANTYLIGVHYRGTDKHQEAPRATYEEMVTHINQAIAAHPNRPIKIFVATDEQAFLDWISQIYPDQVIAYDSIRSTNGRPIHLTDKSNYKLGEDALVDCLLLSKCNILIKTSSNLSLCSAYFNPKIPMVHVTQRSWHAPLE